MTAQSTPSERTDAASERRPPPRRPRSGRRVAVLYNVDYEERTWELDPAWAARAEVGLVAGRVASALAEAGYQASLMAVDGDLSVLRARLTEVAPDCAFNLCESLAGDARLESAVPVMLDLMGIPFTGSPAEALSFGLRKDRVKERLQAVGIPTPAGRVLASAEQPCDLPFPLLVKPVREDGSVGVFRSSVVRSGPELARAVQAVVGRLRQPCLVEQFIDGRELNVTLLGHPTPRVLPLSEIDFSALPAGAPRIVTYDAKWSSGSEDDLGTTPVLNPVLSSTAAARVRRAAAEAFRAIGARDYGRVDVRLSEDGVPHVIDVNPNCDLSVNAGMARAAAAVGIDYPSLVGLLVRYALRRRRAGQITAPAAAARAGSLRPL